MTDDGVAIGTASRDIDRVFDAIAVLLANHSAADDATLRRHMRAVVTAAKGAGLQAELLLRLLKESWHSLPEPMQAVDRMAHFSVLDRLVSLCIREFYRSDAAE